MKLHKDQSKTNKNEVLDRVLRRLELVAALKDGSKPKIELVVIQPKGFEFYKDPQS